MLLVKYLLHTEVCCAPSAHASVGFKQTKHTYEPTSRSGSEQTECNYTIYVTLENQTRYANIHIFIQISLSYSRNRATFRTFASFADSGPAATSAELSTGRHAHRFAVPARNALRPVICTSSGHTVRIRRLEQNEQIRIRGKGVMLSADLGRQNRTHSLMHIYIMYTSKVYKRTRTNMFVS